MCVCVCVCVCVCLFVCVYKGFFVYLFIVLKRPIRNRGKSISASLQIA